MINRKSISETFFGLSLMFVFGIATSASSEARGDVVAAGVAGTIVCFVIGLVVAPKSPEQGKAPDLDAPLTTRVLHEELAHVKYELKRQGRVTAIWAVLGILVGVVLRFA